MDCYDRIKKLGIENNETRYSYYLWEIGNRKHKLIGNELNEYIISILEKIISKEITIADIEHEYKILVNHLDRLEYIKQGRNNSQTIFINELEIEDYKSNNNQNTDDIEDNDINTTSQQNNEANYRQHLIVTKELKQIHICQSDKSNKDIEDKIDKQIQKEIQYKALAAKNQFEFDGLLIQRQDKKTSFLLPNENNETITAYGIIKRLANEANKPNKVFKSINKKININNDNIQILPYSERLRLVFYFRQQYQYAKMIEKADTIAAFINTAIKYTDNLELKQNWQACKAVTETEKEAASLFVCYGWANDYRKEIPRTENAFYTIEAKSGERRYCIVEDDLSFRFAAIERKGRSYEAFKIISDKEMNYKKKYSELQALLKPFMWLNGNIKMGLLTDERELCDNRVKEYINNLLSHNAFDNITLEEHINRVEIDKSDTGIIFAEPRQFVISMGDIEFSDYEYNINAQYNKTNAAALGAARSKKWADGVFSHVVGDEWTTKELNAQGIKKDTITRLLGKKIERIKQGNYRRILG